MTPGAVGQLWLSRAKAWFHFNRAKENAAIGNNIVPKMPSAVRAETFSPIQWDSWNPPSSDTTTGVTTTVYTPVDSTRVGGSAAVWIVERSTIVVRPASGIFGNQYGYADLANYGSAMMSEAYARKANSARGQGYAGYLGPRMKQITMVDDGNAVLSTVTPIDSESMRFDWKAFA